MNQRTCHLVEGSEEAAGTGPKGYDPELPVLQRGGADVLVEHAAHLVEALACDGHPRGRQLLLAQAVGHKQCRGSVFRRLGVTGAAPWGEALAGPQLSAGSVPLPGQLWGMAPCSGPTQHCLLSIIPPPNRV